MISKPKEWVRQHSVTSFFLLAAVMIFVTLFPAFSFLSHKDDLSQIIGLYLARLGTYSPVLAGMFVAGITQPGRRNASLAKRLSIFLPVWVIAFIVHAVDLNLNASSDISTIALVILSIPPALLPALVVTSAFSGSDGIRNMLKTLVKPKGSPVYYLVALLTMPVVIILGSVVTNILNGRAWLPAVGQGADLALTALTAFSYVFFFAGGINEEAGWRGFAQKRMQTKYSPLVANLQLWFLMLICHIPDDIVKYQAGDYIAIRFGLYPLITILMGWLYNRTNGSILAPVIFHASMNAMNPLLGVFPLTIVMAILMVCLTVIAVVSDRMWRRLPADHPAVFQEIEGPA